MEIIQKIINQVELELREEAAERLALGGLAIKKLNIILLGQVSLFSNPEIVEKIILVATNDIDALLDGDISGERIFKKVCRMYGLVYDELSDQIWIPEESTFKDIYESEIISLKVMEPIFVLLSKAIKAKEKNRFLIKQALGLYGEQLAKLIVLHGGDLEFFI